MYVDPVEIQCSHAIPVSRKITFSRVFPLIFGSDFLNKSRIL